MDKINIKEKTIIKWLSIAIAMFLIKMVLPNLREHRRQKEFEEKRIEAIEELYQRYIEASDTTATIVDTINVLDKH